MPKPSPNTHHPDAVILRTLLEHGLLDNAQNAIFEPLTGGVSSEIWKVTNGDRIFCVKRALSKLKVEADWFAPVERNRFEVAWHQIANQYVPGSAPRILAYDEKAKLCAMEFLDPLTHKLWKQELREGRADTIQAGLVGARLGRIHANTAGKDTVKSRFPRTDIFKQIRLGPYLEATADKHADLSNVLNALSERTAQTRLAMIHGDVSPKNLLLGPNGPVLLDAECACIGDPAFDLAFCLNHFLLKCLWTPQARPGFLACFEAMTSNYLDEVTWEERGFLEARAASLLPGLLLARVDGKSPVEYIVDETQKDKVRHCARTLLMNPSDKLANIVDAWEEELTG